MGARREQCLELVLEVGRDDEQQLVTGLQRLLGVGGVDLPVAQDRHQRAVVGERHQPGGRADEGRVGRQGQLDQVGVALSEGEQPDQVADGDGLLDQCDVVIAATGDDKANLVTALLAKTEFGVPRTVGRVNHPNNEWLFTEAWGVDVSVSTPRIMSALVEEAVTVGDLVRLFTFRQGNANLVELTLPEDSPYVGKPAGLIPLPENCALVTILRDGQVYVPEPEQPVESGDELLFVAGAEVEDALERMLAPGSHGG